MIKTAIPNKTKIRNVKIGLSDDGYLRAKNKLKCFKIKEKTGPNGSFIVAERKSITTYTAHTPTKNIFKSLPL
jgi:hypothetical protein